MKLGDLVPVFARAYWRCPQQDCEEAYEAGIIAVVTALRDEIESLPAERCRHREDINFLFYQILAPREGGQAAGGTRGERLATEDASPTCSTPAAPAPDVCEWTNENGRMASSCMPDGVTVWMWNGRFQDKCPNCWNKIKFKTEAQR